MLWPEPYTSLSTLAVYLHVMLYVVRDDVESSEKVAYSREHRFLIEGSPYANWLAKKIVHLLLCIRFNRRADSNMLKFRCLLLSVRLSFTTVSNSA